MPFETLKNMNQTTAKYASWVVRVLAPKLIPYEFTSRGEVVKATKFQCILVSKDPTQFMIGNVPFSFATRDAPSEAREKQGGPDV